MTTDQLWNTGLEKLKFAPSESQIAKLQQYVEMLQRWNKTYNLTAVRNTKDMIPLHIFDSLVVAKYIKGKNCLDVGSGAGLPTIPLAIMLSEKKFTALDTNGKKSRFIQQAVIELGLTNVTVEQCRIENHKNKEPYDAIISRAFASIYDFVTTSSPYLSKSGILYAMKGQFPLAELQYLPKEYTLVKKHDLDVPFVDGERHLLEIKVNH